MVNPRRGASTTGCLFSLILLGAVLYFGIPIAGVYIRYYRLTDEMHSAARLAPSLTNETIQRRVADMVDELALPQAAIKNLRIRRTGGFDRKITLDTEYSETVTLQGFSYTFAFKPHAEEPL
ncbi:MAG: hypothetical protein ACHQXA_07165 [Gemmatimonadales bacterium]